MLASAVVSVSFGDNESTFNDNIRLPDQLATGMATGIAARVGGSTQKQSSRINKMRERMYFIAQQIERTLLKSKKKKK
ncbi:hypothetical protein HMPREF9999_00803 [Alloprevotella sp. oral taxon 473 str. F0040]|nr:hypothetical protein HMPREF9999_00803 [Alloprevotella sp. oral taxon 473 str. F0040]